jgi:hypothetical protein
MRMVRDMGVWLAELLKGIGTFFLHPLFYYATILVILNGYRRVQRERKDFHIRVYSLRKDLLETIGQAIFISSLLSIVTVVLGWTVTIETLVLIGTVTIVLSLFGSYRWLSAAFTNGLSFFALWFMIQYDWSLPIVEQTTGIDAKQLLVSLAFLLGLLLVAEGILIGRKGALYSSPTLIRSRRGLQVGAHYVKKAWVLPILLLLPSGELTSPFEWWPVIQIGAETYSFVLVPFFIGFEHRLHSTLPQIVLSTLGKRIIVVASLVFLLAIVAIWYPFMAIVAVAVGMLGREVLAYLVRAKEQQSPSFFVPQTNGVKILGVIPNTPASKMGLSIGEVVRKVNGIDVHNERSFYEALQKNRAYCKLEVYDTNQQVRFVQGALYEGDHHELGLLFVPEEKKWEEDVG